MPRPSLDAVVVGSGPNGLSAAVALARAGRSVRVLEARDSVGGGVRSAELTLPGFLHDVCSAIHPMAVASPFLRSLPLRSHGLEWIDPVPLAHPLDDGSAAMLERSVIDTAAGLGGDGRAYERLIAPFVSLAEPLLAQLLGPARPPRHPLLLARFGLSALRSATALAHGVFTREAAPALFGGIAAHSMLPLEQRPSAAMGIVMSVAAHAYGWPVPRGGAQRIADALAGHLRELGGEIETSTSVSSYRELPQARVYLFDVSPRQLVNIAGEELPPFYVRRLGRYRYGPGAFKLDFALSEPIPWRSELCARAGTVHLGGTIEEVAAAERAVSEGRHPERPFVLVAQVTDPIDKALKHVLPEESPIALVGADRHVEVEIVREGPIGHGSKRSGESEARERRTVGRSTQTPGAAPAGLLVLSVLSRPVPLTERARGRGRFQDHRHQTWNRASVTRRGSPTTTDVRPHTDHAVMPPVPPSLRGLALGDVTVDDVKWMIREGETLVELKAKIPDEGLGPTISSFANTLGGWVLLGVDDKTREVVGWRPKGRADVVDYLRDLLRHEVDPLPPFAAKAVKVARKPVGLIRVYESTDTPHIVRGTGSVFIREPGAKRSVQEHALLVELARRGEEAGARARARLRETPAVAYTLRTPDSGYANDELKDVRVVARAAPLTVTPAVRDWPLTRSAAEWCLKRASALVPAIAPYGRQEPWLEPFGRGMSAKVAQEKGIEAVDEATVVVDSAGIIGAEIKRGTIRGDSPSIIVEAMLDEEIQPLAQLLSDGLQEAEASGRAAVDLWLLLPPKGSVHGARKDVARDLHAAREFTAPADEGEVRELALSWHREIQRAIGVVKFEREE